MMAGKGLPQDCGLLVVGHGTADRVGEAETRTLVGHISDACPGGAVEVGFLEVIGPSVGESLRRLCARGVDRVCAIECDVEGGPWVAQRYSLFRRDRGTGI